VIDEPPSSGPARSSDPLARLAGMLEQEGGLLAAALGDPPAALGDPPAAPQAGGPDSRSQVSSGPRTRGHEQEYRLVLETIREGYLLHYGAPRVLSREDPDLALLMGDRLYALGLAQLVELGDAYAVAELADLISLCATAHAAGDAQLAEAAWEAAEVAIGWGSDERLAGAQRRARGASPASAPELRSASRERRAP
jgi:hypothetical protein